MNWFLLQLIVMTFVPMPVGASITRPDPSKNEWIFSCIEFKSPYQLARQVYIEYKRPEKSE